MVWMGGVVMMTAFSFLLLRSSDRQFLASLTRYSEKRTRSVAIGVQAFALCGTAIGLVTIAIGIGPRSALDLLLHGMMILLLATGLVTAVRIERS